jgi:hypothetical protein
VCKAETPTDDPAIPKQLFDLIWMGGGPDIEILGHAAEKEIANAAAHEIRHVIELSEAIEHFQRIGIDVAARNRVLGPRNDAGDGHVGDCTKCLHSIC